MSALNGQQTAGRLEVNSHYDPGFIKMVINELENGLSRQSARVKYGLKDFTLEDWIRKFSSKAYRELTAKPSVQFKRSVINAVECGRLSIKEAAQVYKKETRTIEAWIAKSRIENDDLSASNTLAVEREPSQNTPEQGLTADAVKALQQQLAAAQLKIAALNTLIDVAEEQLKINIRKKPGARQS